MKDNYCVLKTKYSKYKMYFNLNQSKNGGIFLNIGTGRIFLTKEQILEVDLPILEIENYDHDKFQEFYGLKEGINE